MRLQSLYKINCLERRSNSVQRLTRTLQSILKFSFPKVCVCVGGEGGRECPRPPYYFTLWPLVLAYPTPYTRTELAIPCTMITLKHLSGGGGHCESVCVCEGR